ncbi:MAG: C4-type zinc ribbon domain-containing protein [bacterium]
MTAPFEEQLALLHELQDIDLDLHTLKKTLATLPDKIAEVESAYSDVKGKLDTSKAELAAVEKVRRTDDSELAASVEHLREREAKLYAIKTNKEYQAALKEISEGKRINREREDRILQSMERIESLGKEIAQLETDCAEKEGAFKSGRESVRAEEESIHARIKTETARRPELIKRIDKDVLRKYDNVRQRFPRALAGVAGGVCQGCSTRVPPQLHNEMLRREGFKICPSCQRLLYVVAAPAEGSVEGEGGS